MKEKNAFKRKEKQAKDNAPSLNKVPLAASHQNEPGVMLPMDCPVVLRYLTVDEKKHCDTCRVSGYRVPAAFFCPECPFVVHSDGNTGK